MSVLYNWLEAQYLFDHLEISWANRANHHHLIPEMDRQQMAVVFINTRAALENSHTEHNLRHLNMMLTCLNFLVSKALIEIHFS